MISCGTIYLLWNCRDNIVINGLSNNDHMKGGSLVLKPPLHEERLLMSQITTPLLVALEVCLVTLSL